MKFKEIKDTLIKLNESDFLELFFEEDGFSRIYAYTKIHEDIKFMKDIAILECVIDSIDVEGRSANYKVIAKKENVLFCITLWRDLDLNDAPFIYDIVPATKEKQTITVYSVYTT